MEKEYGVSFVSKIKFGILVLLITVLIGVLGYTMNEKHHGYEKRGDSFVSLEAKIDSFGRGENV